MPQAPQPWLALSRIALLQGEVRKAEAVIDEGLAATSNNPDLLWAKASILERDGDIDGAIANVELLRSECGLSRVPTYDKQPTGRVLRKANAMAISFCCKRFTRRMAH